MSSRKEEWREMPYCWELQRVKGDIQLLVHGHSQDAQHGRLKQRNRKAMQRPERSSLQIVDKWENWGLERSYGQLLAGTGRGFEVRHSLSAVLIIILCLAFSPATLTWGSDSPPAWALVPCEFLSTVCLYVSCGWFLKGTRPYCFPWNYLFY